MRRSLNWRLSCLGRRLRQCEYFNTFDVYASSARYGFLCLSKALCCAAVQLFHCSTLHSFLLRVN